MAEPARPGSFTGATNSASSGGLFGDTLVSGIPDIVAADVTRAETAATNAATSETNAATSATNAAASAASVGANAAAAAASATAAAGSATSASASATSATASQTSASTSATTATTQATNAAASATSASASATAASTQATNATTQASNALSSSNSAAASAASAGSSATSAAADATAAAATYDAFDDRYLGDKATDPTLDNDGNALLDGALYFDTTLNVMKVYDLGNTQWVRTTPTSSDQAAINAVTANATNINAVNANSANINTVAGINTDITTVATNDTNVTTVAGISADVTTVSGIAANVTSVAGNSANINAVAADATDIGTVATNIANVNTVAGIDSDVTTVAGIAADVTAAATNVADIQAISAAIADVITVANDLNEATSEIDVVANNIANVNAVGTDIANVNTVASNLADVNAFADTYFISATAPASPTSGDLWFDTSVGVDTMKVYGASGWQNAGSSVNGTSQRVTYTATAGQTSFAATYDAGYVDVYLNGIKLINGTDFTATNGTSIVLASGAALNDTVNIIGYGTFSISNFSINDANDVAASGATNGQFLQYNGSNWVGGTVSTPTLSSLGIANHDQVTVTAGGAVTATSFAGDGSSLTGITIPTLTSLGIANHDQVTVTAGGAVTATSYAGDGSALTGVEAFASGTKMLFGQTAAPTGWTKITTDDDAALRIVSGTVGSGGSSGLSTALATPSVTGTIAGSTGAHTLTIAEMPSHTHDVGYSLYSGGPASSILNFSSQYLLNQFIGYTTSNPTGGGGSHSHSLSATFSGGTAAINVKYVDAIMASKD
jgi:hypothetical protein